MRSLCGLVGGFEFSVHCIRKHITKYDVMGTNIG